MMAGRHPTASTTRCRGFTLVEAIATISIVAIVGMVSARLMMAGADGYAATAARAELTNSASAAMERMAIAIREIPQRASVSPIEPAISSVTATSIAWDGDMAIAASGGVLQLTVAGVASTLAADVSAFSVETFDESNVPLSGSLSGDACDAVRRVQITLTLSRHGVSETLRSRFFLRCMISGASS